MTIIYHPDTVNWLGISGSGKELYFTNREAMRLIHEKLKNSDRRPEFGNKSFEVGGARLAETYEEAMRRRWYDVADLFADDEPEPDEQV